MANIKLNLDYPIYDGIGITFKAPCDCTVASGLKICHTGGEQVFTFRDAHNNNLADIGDVFAKGSFVKVVLDIDGSNAYIQNADNNAHLHRMIHHVVDDDSIEIGEIAKLGGNGGFIVGRDNIGNPSCTITGKGNIGECDFQHVEGKYNAPDSAAARIVGNGSSNTDRKNIETLDWLGNLWVRGNIFFGGNNMAEGAKLTASSVLGLKMVTGSYVGNGLTKKTLNFDIAPTLIILAAGTKKTGSDTPNHAMLINPFNSYVAENSMVQAIPTEWGEKSVTWGFDKAPSFQQNGTTYYYTAASWHNGDGCEYNFVAFGYNPDWQEVTNLSITDSLIPGMASGHAETAKVYTIDFQPTMANHFKIEWLPTTDEALNEFDILEIEAFNEEGDMLTIDDFEIPGGVRDGYPFSRFTNGDKTSGIVVKSKRRAIIEEAIDGWYITSKFNNPITVSRFKVYDREGAMSNIKLYVSNKGGNI